jgi:small subunit ribosomal protein S8
VLTDPVADYLTRVRNALIAHHDEVEIPASGLKSEISRILQEQGYISGFKIEPGRVGDVLRVQLKYSEEREPAIHGLKRVSRPGRRSYVDHNKVPRVQGGMGTAILSTSSGVMTGHEARSKGVGGEVLAFVW